MGSNVISTDVFQGFFNFFVDPLSQNCSLDSYSLESFTSSHQIHHA